MSTLTYEHVNYFVYNKKKMQLNGHLLKSKIIKNIMYSIRNIEFR
jgi:hypothetical protein